MKMMRTDFIVPIQRIDDIKPPPLDFRQHRTIVPAALCGYFTPGFCSVFLQYIKYCRENAPHPDAKYSRKSRLSNDAGIAFTLL
ncbi:MAG: hypothetical protein ACLRO1_04530 [Agathobaculum sp.]